MPVMDGIEATRALVAEDLGRVLILTTFDRDDYVFDGLQAGASGFLLKNADPDQLVDAVRAVGHGHALLAPEVTRRVIARMTTGRSRATRPGPAPARAAGAPSTGLRGAAVDARLDGLERLTDREREVLVLVARGMSNGEIARAPVPRRGHRQDPRLELPGQAARPRPGAGRRPRLRGRPRPPGGGLRLRLRGDPPGGGPRLAWPAWDRSRHGADPHLRRRAGGRRRRPRRAAGRAHRLRRRQRGGQDDDDAHGHGGAAPGCR